MHVLRAPTLFTGRRLFHERYIFTPIALRVQYEHGRRCEPSLLSTVRPGELVPFATRYRMRYCVSHGAGARAVEGAAATAATSPRSSAAAEKFPLNHGGRGRTVCLNRRDRSPGRRRTRAHVRRRHRVCNKRKYVRQPFVFCCKSRGAQIGNINATREIHEKSYFRGIKFTGGPSPQLPRTKHISSYYFYRVRVTTHFYFLT